MSEKKVLNNLSNVYGTINKINVQYTAEMIKDVHSLLRLLTVLNTYRLCLKINHLHRFQNNTETVQFTFSITCIQIKLRLIIHFPLSNMGKKMS